MPDQTSLSDQIQARPIVPPPFRGAMLRLESDLPFIDLGDGSQMQLIQVDLAQGLWIVRMLFHPGCRIDRHYHTGPVYAFTLSGAWHYEEYPEEVNRAGAFLFEPAGSVHTLRTLPGSDEPADVWFAVFGANVNMTDDGQVSGIVDAASVLGIYRALCKAQGLSSDKVIVLGE
jgi:2,4'-dihydroxyacetophenone dioxygenase